MSHLSECLPILGRQFRQTELIPPDGPSDDPPAIDPLTDYCHSHLTPRFSFEEFVFPLAYQNL